MSSPVSRVLDDLQRLNRGVERVDRLELQLVNLERSLASLADETTRCGEEMKALLELAAGTLTRLTLAQEEHT